MAEWLVPLRGEAHVLALLAEDLVEPDLAVRRHEQALYLAFTKLVANTHDREIRDIAEELVARINGIARVLYDRPQQIEIARFERDDGKRD